MISLGNQVPTRGQQGVTSAQTDTSCPNRYRISIEGASLSRIVHAFREYTRAALFEVSTRPDLFGGLALSQQEHKGRGGGTQGHHHQSTFHRPNAVGLQRGRRVGPRTSGDRPLPMGGAVACLREGFHAQHAKPVGSDQGTGNIADCDWGAAYPGSCSHAAPGHRSRVRVSGMRKTMASGVRGGRGEWTILQ